MPLINFKLSIMLPVKDDGTIDYDYMEIRLPVIQILTSTTHILQHS